MAKRTARVRTTFNILNIKLRQPDSKESSPKQYADLLIKMSVQKSRIKLAPELGAVIRRCVRERVGGQEIIIGFITKYTIIKNGRWISLENPDADEIDVPIPANTAANSADTAFYFTPTNHRLALLKKPGSLTPQNAKLFLERAFAQVLTTGQHVEIDIAPSQEQYERILKSQTLSRLEITLTYSNNDLNPDFAELLDDDLKVSNTDRLSLIAVAQKGELLDVQKSSILTGALLLARDNGEVKATETTPTGRRQTIQPSSSPRKETIVSEQPSDILRDVSGTLLTIYPREATDGQRSN